MFTIKLLLQVLHNLGLYANPSLMWEATNIKDIGFDASLFKNKLTIEFDVFRRNTNGIL